MQLADKFREVIEQNQKLTRAQRKQLAYDYLKHYSKVILNERDL